MTTLPKHEIVLEYFAVHDDGAAVFRVPADDGQPTPNVEEYKLPDQLWRDMGSPSRVSLIVEPNDKLNQDG